MIYDDIYPEYQRRAEAFHAANPRVMELFITFALAAKRAGHKVGADMVWNRIRWEAVVQTTDAASEYKVNDAYRGWYARAAMAVESELNGYFEIRRTTPELVVAA